MHEPAWIRNTAHVTDPPPTRMRHPQILAPTEWAFPDLSTAPLSDPVAQETDSGPMDGLIAVGADLEPSTLVAAYRAGIFPWPHGSRVIPWFSPEPRGVLPLERLRVTRSLRQTLRRSGWTATVDTDFDQVIDRCAERPGEGTWITRNMKRAYRRLHELGHAHSIEVWDADVLVGGLYGMSVGGVFTGESMFHRASDASKVAMVELAHRLAEAGGSLIDVQLVTPHLESLGAIGIRRPLYIELLAELRDDDVRLITDALPVARLAGTTVELATVAPPRREDVIAAVPARHDEAAKLA